jgi:hypothetical protein
MFRILAPLAAALAFVPAAADAASYAARPVAPVAQAKLIANDISWACGSGGCTGATDYGRPILLCQDLAKQAGRIDQFVVNGRAFGPAELDKCNSVAKASSGTALARN